MPHYLLTVVFDPAYDQYVAVKVYQDGNPIRLKAFATRDEAEEFIDLLERDRTWAA
jgi:hypothetical protein